ncbi:hypothetical protein LSUE1_G006622, partial [Lachnellula suecica]
PTQSSFHPSNPYSPTHRQVAFGDYQEAGPSRRSQDEPAGNGKGHRRRGSSLSERYPGDMSHRPLDQLRKETKIAYRSPHTRKKHVPGADTIDSLDRSVFGPYHHEGPYDATLLARNTSYNSSPVAAVSGTNAEALKATPRENVKDSLDRHVPLSGVAVIPPGMSGLDGRVMEYEEGADLMRETDAPGGAYKRWPDMKYHPDDLKGKGEPSYTIEKSLKDHKHSSHRRVTSEGDNSYEMQPQSRLQPRPTTSRQRSGNNADLGGPSKTMQRYSDFEGDMRRSNSTGQRIGDGLKKRFGSLRRSKKNTTEP